MKEATDAQLEPRQALDPEYSDRAGDVVTTEAAGVGSIGGLGHLPPQHLSVKRDPPQIDRLFSSGEKARDTAGIVAEDERMLVRWPPDLGAARQPRGRAESPRDDLALSRVERSIRLRPEPLRKVDR